MIDKILSPAAAADLDNIWFYGADNWGYKQADSYQSQIIDMIVFLAEHPEMGKDRSTVKTGYKSYAIGSHVVFFRKTNTSIRVLRILHQRMDFVRHLVN